MAPTPAQPLTPAARAQAIKGCARTLGFDTVGITDLSPTPHADALTQWLELGFAGTMRYLHRQAAKRREPARIVPGATRAIVVTRNYYNADPPPEPHAGRVAKYARGEDYHHTLAAPLEGLAARCVAFGATPAHTRSYVDAGPVPERELAQRAGLGWIGKNTMLIDPERGSFFFLACVLTDLDLALDPPFDADRCGSCTACLDACPTHAFPEPRVLDATRCISYATIEHKGPLPEAVAGQRGDWIFGCDICNDVCPWNQKFASSAGAMEMTPRLAWLRRDVFTDMSAEEFGIQYGSTPLERPGLAGMRRNCGD
ncbi:MAG: tRNA epoxyqueuosine(34) reductase QueG [Gemmatimonadales bacterium]